MKLKKQIKKERAKRRRDTLISLVIMTLMPYLVFSISRDNIFKGWEVYFALGYVAVIDILLLVNIFRTVSKNNFSFDVQNEKIKIKDGIFRQPFQIHFDKIAYVDVCSRENKEFEVLIVMESGKRNKKFYTFDESFAGSNQCYKAACKHMKNTNPDKKFYCYIMKKAGTVKYYYLYILFKNSYNAQFSHTAMEYVKRFIEEYNLL